MASSCRAPSCREAAWAACALLRPGAIRGPDVVRSWGKLGPQRLVTTAEASGTRVRSRVECKTGRFSGRAVSYETYSLVNVPEGEVTSLDKWESLSLSAPPAPH